MVDNGGGRPERCGVPVEETKVTREARRPDNAEGPKMTGNQESLSLGPW